MVAKGGKMSEEHKAKIAAALRGRPKSEAHKASLKKHHRGRTGIPHTKESKEKIGRAHRGKVVSAETRAKISKAKKGKPGNRKGAKFTPAQRRRLSAAHKGVEAGLRNPNWAGGITASNQRAREGVEYRLWREAVFKRDNYTCQACHRKKEVSGRLRAHHIKPFAYHQELRFDVSNGQTLCIECHEKTENFGTRAKKFRRT